jgi:CPA1 family monovalent cation:H+ antiporter
VADDLEIILFFLLVVVTALTALARILDVPYPILLVVGGAAVGFAPGIPDVELEPDLVLLFFLPPLLFNAAYFASVRDLRRNLRTITLQAVLLVLVTMCAVAAALHAMVPEIPWAAAFAFGAIVSPTDPLAAVTIAQRVGVPRRIVTIVEGESLINDGTALVAYRVAVAAAVGGTFDLLDATGDFVVNVLGGVAVGVVVAYVLLLALRRLVSDSTLGVTVSLTAGFAAYLPAEHLHVSGVIAAVTVGLVLGHQAHQISTSASRLRGYAFWEVLVFLLNAVLFVLVGLQLPGILEDQQRSAGELAALGAVAGGVVIASRLVWAHTVPYVVRALDRRPSQRARRVGWRLRMVSAWSGMRGSVSLAAALALPEGFPERDLLVFLTLCVIFATLVLQGLTLPWLIRRLGIQDDGEAAREELIARKQATKAALDRLEVLQAEDWTRDDTIERMVRQYDFRYRRLRQRAMGVSEEDEEDLDERSRLYQRTVRDVLDTQRAELVRMRDAGEISDSVLHALQRELDLEDQRLEI